MQFYVNRLSLKIGNYIWIICVGTTTKFCLTMELVKAKLSLLFRVMIRSRNSRRTLPVFCCDPVSWTVPLIDSFVVSNCRVKPDRHDILKCKFFYFDLVRLVYLFRSWLTAGSEQVLDCLTIGAIVVVPIRWWQDGFHTQVIRPFLHHNLSRTLNTISPPPPQR